MLTEWKEATVDKKLEVLKEAIKYAVSEIANTQSHLGKLNGETTCSEDFEANSESHKRRLQQIFNE